MIIRLLYNANAVDRRLYSKCSGLPIIALQLSTIGMQMYILGGANEPD
jgi:hypothetical protein